MALERVGNNVGSCASPNTKSCLPLSALWSIILIVVEIYSELSLLTPAALVLNEWPVKLMGQSQSFLVAYFIPHMQTYSHALPPFHLSSCLFFCLLQCSAASGCGHSFMSPNHNGYKTWMKEWAMVFVTLMCAVLEEPWHQFLSLNSSLTHGLGFHFLMQRVLIWYHFQCARYSVGLAFNEKWHMNWYNLI